ncbi:leucyl aminopeptidase [Hwanghaeella grinnelliae]|uniref:Probable cytosol aminopeptidase n=1 Tax=Hwanghaeella grinnelliae TaxID=2500179 RepID=A0A437QVD6_9PROT|nr:leucyl aminopeptidase [Hwanghaeella grinnelliae]RVU38484.1 leucyl aminopeptidase [Hwanghaeella grinnelliae]
MKISFAEKASPKSGAVVVGVEEGKKLTPSAQELEKASGGALSRAMKASSFTGKKGQSLQIAAPANVAADRIVLVGLGKGLTDLDFQSMGGNLVPALNAAGDKEAVVYVDGGADVLAEAAANIGAGLLMRSYRFDRYRTKETADQKPTLKKATIVVSGAAAARKAFKPLEAVAEGVNLTRDLVSEPPNVLHPESFAEEAAKLAEIGITVEILNEKKMEKLGMHSLLGVGLGSARESRLVVMHWNGAASNSRPVAFVGKGVTFDTGGISLKPGPGMEDMKWDMGGAGVVTGLMKALALRKAKVNVIGVLGLVENMPDGAAQRPGDIVTSMSGQTIEIHNTDAEGRLVLADALWYTQDKYKPRLMIDLATLTGAIIIALGHEYAGFFSNDDDISAMLSAAGEATGEKVWRLPLAEAYDNQLKTDGADMKNIGGRAAGSITAAQFLQRFVNKVPWAHLDIAGVTWSSKDAPTVPKGATAFGVRLLDKFVADNYEK